MGVESSAFGVRLDAIPEICHKIRVMAIPVSTKIAGEQADDGLPPEDWHLG